MTDPRAFGTLVEYLQRFPTVSGSTATDHFDDGGWWVKFSMDTLHKLAWHTVKELGNVLNYLSLNERLPTVFMPVSPSPYLNGGPAEYLSWVIECHDREFKPGPVMKCLEGRLPRPVEREAEWLRSDDDKQAIGADGDTSSRARSRRAAAQLRRWTARLVSSIAYEVL